MYLVCSQLKEPCATISPVLMIGPQSEHTTPVLYPACCIAPSPERSSAGKNGVRVL